jgi:hypothetical protein
MLRSHDALPSTFTKRSQVLGKIAGLLFLWGGSTFLLCQMIWNAINPNDFGGKWVYRFELFLMSLSCYVALIMYRAFRKLRLLIQILVFSAIICVTATVFFTPRYSETVTSSVLQARGFDNTAKATQLWLENRVTFQEAAFAVEQKLNGRDCLSGLEDILLIPLKEKFLIFPVHIHGFCSSSTIVFPLIDEGGGFSGINSWRIEYWIRPPKRIQCSEGIECTKLEPKWYLRSFVN